MHIKPTVIRKALGCSSQRNTGEKASAKESAKRIKRRLQKHNATGHDKCDGVKRPIGGDRSGYVAAVSDQQASQRRRMRTHNLAHHGGATAKGKL
jgi:hypothetical protein